MMRTIISCFLFVSCFAASPAHAQVGTMQWHFKSRAEVIPAVQQTRGNLRSTYNVLICAARQGYINTALSYYEGIVSKGMFDASVQDSAAFAFAHDLADGFIPWNWKKDINPSNYQGTKESKVIFLRDRAYSKSPHLAEVLVMRSYKSRYLFKEDRKQAYEWALEAVKRSPKWADAHYWLAQSAEYYGLSLQNSKSPEEKAQAIQLGRIGMRSYDKAENLDPNMRPYTYLGRIGLSQLIADKKAAKMIPIYVNAQLRSFPNYSPWLKKRWNQTEGDYREMYDKIASQIAQKATS